MLVLVASSAQAGTINNTKSNSFRSMAVASEEAGTEVLVCGSEDADSECALLVDASMSGMKKVRDTGGALGLCDTSGGSCSLAVTDEGARGDKAKARVGCTTSDDTETCSTEATVTVDTSRP